VIYILKDHLGSGGHKLFENNGLWRYEETTPFGQTVMSGFGLNTQQKKFVGKEQDESGLYYYGALYYDPWQCRFVSVDPLWRQNPHEGGYVYAGDNPIMFTDPTGMSKEGAGGGGPTTPPTDANDDLSEVRAKYDRGEEVTLEEFTKLFPIQDPTNYGNIEQQVDTGPSEDWTGRAAVGVDGSFGSTEANPNTTNFGGASGASSAGDGSGSANGIGPGGQAAPGGSGGAGGAAVAEEAAPGLSAVEPKTEAPSLYERAANYAEQLYNDIDAKTTPEGFAEAGLMMLPTPGGKFKFLGALGSVLGRALKPVGRLGSWLVKRGGKLGREIFGTGPIEAWFRFGESFTRVGDQFVQRSIRWGSTYRHAKNKIPSNTWRRFNQIIREKRVPLPGWRFKDPGHIHLGKKPPGYGTP